MLSWIATPTGVWRDPLTQRAADDLGIGIPQMVGHLQILWSWTLEFAPDGNLSRYRVSEIAAAALWDGDDKAAFVQALLDAGWLAESGDGPEVVGWYEIGGRLIEAREKDRLRKQRARPGEPPNGPAPASNRNGQGSTEFHRSSTGIPSEFQSTNKQTNIQTYSTEQERESVLEPPARTREERPVRALAPVPKAESAKAPMDVERRSFYERFAQVFPRRNGILAEWEKAQQMLRRIAPDRWEAVLRSAANYARSPDVLAGFPKHACNWLESWEEWEHYEPPVEQERPHATRNPSAADRRATAVASTIELAESLAAGALDQPRLPPGRPGHTEPQNTRRGNVVEGSARSVG